MRLGEALPPRHPLGYGPVCKFFTFNFTFLFSSPQLQVQTEAELSLEEIKEREAAIRKLEVRKLNVAMT